MNKLIYILRKHTPAILTGTALVASAGACVFSGIGALKSEEMIQNERPITAGDKALIYLRAYWPAGVCYAASAVSMIFSHKVSLKQIAAITAICAGAEEKFGRYRAAIRERLGSEQESEIFVESAKREWPVTPPLPAKCDDYDDSYVFYDVFSDRYFISSIERVQQAMYHINRSLTINGYCLLNEFYEMLGLKGTDEGEYIGWSDVYFIETYGKVPWIEFRSVEKSWEDPNSTHYFVITYDIDPCEKAIDDVFYGNS